MANDSIVPLLFLGAAGYLAWKFLNGGSVSLPSFLAPSSPQAGSAPPPKMPASSPSYSMNQSSYTPPPQSSSAGSSGGGGMFSFLNAPDAATRATTAQANYTVPSGPGGVFQNPNWNPGTTSDQANPWAALSNQPLANTAAQNAAADAAIAANQAYNAAHTDYTQTAQQNVRYTTEGGYYHWVPV